MSPTFESIVNRIALDAAAISINFFIFLKMLKLFIMCDATNGLMILLSLNFRKFTFKRKRYGRTKKIF